MFKKKKKGSNKNDEIFVDYSKDIDVKITEDDEAIPEHYEALKVDDDVVVSKGQIREAVQRKVQDAIIENMIKEAAKQKELDDSAVITKSQADEIVIDKTDDKQTEKTDKDVLISTNTIPPTITAKDEQQFQKNGTTVDSFDEQSVFADDDDDDDFAVNKSNDVHDEEEVQHRSYPSFLHEELNLRRKLEPMQEKEEKKQEEFLSEEKKTNLGDTDIDLEDLTDSKVIKDIEIETQDDVEKKQDLDSFFGNDSSVLKRGASKDIRKEKKQHKEHIKTPLYQYKHHAFYSMEEFTMFLQTNYNNLEEIAQDILKDEQFFRWLKEESDQFEESILKMKKMKQDLKQ